MNDKPITDQQLAEWRSRLRDIERCRDQAGKAGNATAAMAQTYGMAELAIEAMQLLIAEVERLRAERQEWEPNE